jgi:hypothetical protein
MKIYIKNMVCQGTRKFVLMEIKKLGLNLKSLELDVLEFQGELSPSQEVALEYRLGKYGLETVKEISLSGFNPFYKNEFVDVEALQ